MIEALDSFVSPEAVPLAFRTTTQYIVVHHAAAVYRRGDACNRIFEHHNRNWPRYGRIGYHIVLQEEPNNTIQAYLVNPLGAVGAHVRDRNKVSVGVCAATNFGNALPSARWFEPLASVVRELARLYPKAEIVGHRDIALPISPTACPGGAWNSWKDLLIDTVRAGKDGDFVIGVTPSCTLYQFTNFLVSRKAPITVPVIERVYTFAKWLDVDPAFVAAVWHKEQTAPEGLGATRIGKLTRNPFNIKSYGRWPSVVVGGVSWNSYETWQLGLFGAVLHLKQLYGAEGLQTIEQIIPKFAPASDSNDPVVYAAKVRETMKAIRAL